jgi:hypothetical protein
MKVSPVVYIAITIGSVNFDWGSGQIDHIILYPRRVCSGGPVNHQLVYRSGGMCEVLARW